MAVMRARVTVWTVAGVDECFSRHLKDLPGGVSGVRKLELSRNLTERRIPESEHFPLLSNLVLLASELGPTGQSSLGAPSTIRRFRCEFTLGPS